jgi:hypothetical protein
MRASTPAKSNLTFGSLIAAFREWVRRRRLLQQCRLRLDTCDKNEIERMAHDVGLSPSELRQLAERGPGAAKLLFERLTALHLDADALVKSEPSTMRDMQRLCSSCVSKKRCQLDLMLVPDDPHWRQYCPNAGTLDAMRSETAGIR